MDRRIAERLIASTFALDSLLGEMDSIISEIPDEADRKALARSLGDIIGGLYLAFIRPIELEYPDLAEKE